MLQNHDYIIYEMSQYHIKNALCQAAVERLRRKSKGYLNNRRQDFEDRSHNLAKILFQHLGRKSVKVDR